MEKYIRVHRTGELRTGEVVSIYSSSESGTTDGDRSYAVTDVKANNSHRKTNIYHFLHQIGDCLNVLLL